MSKVKLKISGSNAQLATLCAYWVDKEVDEKPTPDVALEGVRLHALAECILRGEVDESSLSHASDKAVAKRVREVMEQPGFAIVCAEAAFVYNVMTAEIRQVDTGGEHRNYGFVSSDEIPFTIDLIYRCDRGVVACDWKFGPAGLAHYTAKGSVQLFLAANAAAHVAKVGLLSVACEYRDITGAVSTHRFELDEAQKINAGLMSAKTVLNPLPSSGQHCVNCKYLVHCPDGTEALLSPVADALGPQRLVLQPLSPADVVNNYATVRRIKRLLDAAEEANQEYASKHRVVDKDGKVYEKRLFGGTSYSVQAARFTDQELEQLVKQGKATVREESGRWGWYKK